MIFHILFTKFKEHYTRTKVIVQSVDFFEFSSSRYLDANFFTNNKINYKMFILFSQTYILK